MTAIAMTVLIVAFLLSGLFTVFGFRLRFKSTRSKLFIAAVTYVISLLTLAPISFLLFVVLIIPVLAVYATLRRSANGTHAT